MARKQHSEGEKPLFWTGSSKEDLLKFPDPVKDGIGTALSVAQFGGKHPSAKPWKEEEGCREPVGNHDSNKAADDQEGSHTPQSSTSRRLHQLYFCARRWTARFEVKFWARASLRLIGLRLLLRLWREDPLDLLEVVEVVPGHHVEDSFDGFFATLGVHAVMLPLLWLQRLQH